MLVTVTFCAQDKRFRWKNRSEELGLSCKTRFCVSASVCVYWIYPSACVFECAYLQPRIFVSPPRGVHALQVDHSGQLLMQGWPVVLCCVHERYAFGIPLPYRPWLSFRPFGGQTCQQNRLAAEGIKAAWKVMLCEVMIVSVWWFVRWILISTLLPESSLSAYWYFATSFFFFLIVKSSIWQRSKCFSVPVWPNSSPTFLYLYFECSSFKIQRILCLKKQESGLYQHRRFTPG